VGGSVCSSAGAWSTPDAQRQETPGPRASGPGVSLPHAPPPIRGDSATARAVEAHGVMGHVEIGPRLWEGDSACAANRNRPRSGAVANIATAPDLPRSERDAVPRGNPSTD
jgi:hypothetical protein